MVGIGALWTTPKLETEGHWAGRYRANVGGIELLFPPVSEGALLEAAPLWKWLTYPRMYTTPVEEVASILRELVAKAPRASKAKKRGA